MEIIWIFGKVGLQIWKERTLNMERTDTLLRTSNLERADFKHGKNGHIAPAGSAGLLQGG